MTADSWIERVRAADKEAEEAFAMAFYLAEDEGDPSKTNDRDVLIEIAQNLHAIAAELRAQRIARRPGAGA